MSKSQRVKFKQLIRVCPSIKFEAPVDYYSEIKAPVILPLAPRWEPFKFSNWHFRYQNR